MKWKFHYYFQIHSAASALIIMNKHNIYFFKSSEKKPTIRINMWLHSNSIFVLKCIYKIFGHQIGTPNELSRCKTTRQSKMNFTAINHGKWYWFSNSQRDDLYPYIYTKVVDGWQCWLIYKPVLRFTCGHYASICYSWKVILWK